MNKDLTYYRHLAEESYLSHFEEIKAQRDNERKETVEMLKKEYKEKGKVYEDKIQYHTFVNVNTQDESCSFPKNYNRAVRTMELLFMCSMEDGKVVTSFIRDGKDKIAELLGLVDLYDKTEVIEVNYVRGEDKDFHFYLPERLQRHSKDFYKVKLYGLEDFVNECNYTGWGDSMTSNVLEVIAGIMTQKFIDFEKNEIRDYLDWHVGPADDDDMGYYAHFDFSHCELAKEDDSDTGWAVFICYNYKGIDEYVY